MPKSSRLGITCSDGEASSGSLDITGGLSLASQDVETQIAELAGSLPVHEDLLLTGIDDKTGDRDRGEDSHRDQRREQDEPKPSTP